MTPLPSTRNIVYKYFLYQYYQPYMYLALKCVKHIFMIYLHITVENNYTNKNTVCDNCKLCQNITTYCDYWDKLKKNDVFHILLCSPSVELAQCSVPVMRCSEYLKTKNLERHCYFRNMSV